MRVTWSTACLILCLHAGVAAAQDSTNDIWTRGNLLGDLGGARSSLSDHGLTFGLQDLNEVFGNVSGGKRKGASYDGVTLFGVGLDTQKAGGWDGGLFNIDAFVIRGRDISTDNLLNLQTASGFLASPTTRLWEVWYQQSFLDGRIDVKLGQQSLDQEFTVSQYANLFINTAMGWAVLPSLDLYAGGPAYPLSSLGVRLRAQPADGVTALLGVFDDNPPGGPFNADSQLLGTTRWGPILACGPGCWSSARFNMQSTRSTRTARRPTGCPALTNLASGMTQVPSPIRTSTTPECRLPSPPARGLR